MFEFFAAIRRLLMAAKGGSLGAIALSAIADNFIPRLKARLAKENDPDSRKKIEEVIASWEHYIDHSSPDSKMWENIAAKTVRDMVVKFRLNPNLADDVEQQAAYDYYSEPRMHGLFDKFDPMGGPSAFMRWWKTLMFTFAGGKARDLKREEQRQHPSYQEQSEGGTSMIDLVPSPKTISEFDEDRMAEIKQDLDAFIAKRLGRNPASILSYKVWLDLAESGNPSQIRFSRDIVPTVSGLLKKKNLPASSSTINNAWDDVKRTITEFFKKELDTPIPRDLMKSLRVAERVAYSEYRRRLAAWILGQ